ncbi:alanine racemase [Salinispira pacifica]|uniref:alanine racemase n=1 Tax=Salinispira pacifica TaxID=1307761 RepID=UPI00146FAFAB|nr:alanine racemase [Salinispira pacifica]
MNIDISAGKQIHHRFHTSGMELLQHPGRRVTLKTMTQTRAIINLENFRHNLSVLQKQAGRRPLCLAVKADAYGHGAVRMAREAEAWGIRHFGVARVSEAVELREAGIGSRIFLFSIADRGEEEFLFTRNIEPFVSDLDYFHELAECRNLLLKQAVISDEAPDLGIHVKTDTGMGRLGCPPEDIPALAKAVFSTPGFRIAGLATHFPLSDDPGDSLAPRQAALLKAAAEELESRGMAPEFVHGANSGGILFHGDDGSSMMRPGIAAYGYAPDSAFAEELTRRNMELKPVMELRAPVTFVKKVPPGTSISYGHTWTSNEESWIATVNAGYADGYPRIVSNNAAVLIEGRQLPQVGRICMDQCMVDCGPRTPVQRYSDAVLFGFSPGAETASTLADKAGTIAYEITCGISPRVQRVYM